MLSFRFWGSDPRGSDATLPMPLFAKPVQAFLDSTATKPSLQSANPLKRRRDSLDYSAVVSTVQNPLPAKRIKIEAPAVPAEQKPAASRDDPPRAQASVASGAGPELERVQDVIQFQLGLEILYKHDELRLINQELAKCQIALEQLRRCHLIPYPVSCPTPQQMLEISDGKGPAVRTRPGEPVPEWAPPFGVVDGPYARHYAKWLIPDPKFDGVLREWPGIGPASSSRSAAEGRTTRNSIGDVGGGFGKQRPGRGMSGHKLHSLTTGVPPPKERAGPCVLKRSDGKTVKLVCLDCHRDNFSSTQGFINHCRIAHKRDFKSHEEAAVHCGHPIEVDAAGGSAVAGVERPKVGGAPNPPTSTPSSAPSAHAAATGLVHPFARSHDIEEQEAYAALRSRLEASMKLHKEGKLPSTTEQLGRGTLRPVAAAAGGPTGAPAGSSFVFAGDAPHLSRLLKGRNVAVDLAQQVADAKTRTVISDMYAPDDDSEDGEPASGSTDSGSPIRPPAAAMRMPARTTIAPAVFPAGTRPPSSKGASHTGFETPMATPTAEVPPASRAAVLYDDEMDVDLSPNPSASNNAPSLVSDDGEYDDSDDDGSSSDASDHMETSSVTEINLEDDQEVQDHLTPRATLRKGGESSVGLQKEENRHVTFVSPVRTTAGKARRRKQTA